MLKFIFINPKYDLAQMSEQLVAYGTSSARV